MSESTVKSDIPTIIDKSLAGKVKTAANLKLNPDLVKRKKPLSGVTSSPEREFPPPVEQKLTAPTDADPATRCVAETWNRYGGLILEQAAQLQIDPAVAVAVLVTESSGRGFQDQRLVIRFENHIFHEQWGEQNEERFRQHFRFNADRRWTGHYWRPDPNGTWQPCHGSQNVEWQVFSFARQLDESAAMCSISMGAPQIMGFHHHGIGYDTVQAMFTAFASDVWNQLDGFFRFIVAKDLVMYLREGDLLTFAQRYNGLGQAELYKSRIEENIAIFQKLQAAADQGSGTPVPSEKAGERPGSLEEVGSDVLVTDGFDFPCGAPNGVGFCPVNSLAQRPYFDTFNFWHTGEDWNGYGGDDTDLGATVYAVANGVVTASDYFASSWGNVVLIDHTLPSGEKIWSQYAHLRDRFVRSGDEVRRGTPLGTLGKGANDRWPAHLHFELRRRDLPPDNWCYKRPEQRIEVFRDYWHPSEYIKVNRPGLMPLLVEEDGSSTTFIRSTSDQWHESDIGLGNHTYWAYTLSTKERCWGEWRPRITATGVYEVMAYVPRLNATTTQARYEIHYRNGREIRMIDQSQYFDEWVSLGQFPCSTTPAMATWVRLSDQTGEPYTQDANGRKQIAFDAMSFIRITGE